MTPGAIRMRKLRARKAKMQPMTKSQARRLAVMKKK